ncbi:MAG TPA: hypothetical protein VLS27_11120, partial [Gammaproteobacteria bacterium]|nr:hypothetical protein [Gammaproteobacteria bacterium]
YEKLPQVYSFRAFGIGVRVPEKRIGDQPPAIFKGNCSIAGREPFGKTKSKGGVTHDIRAFMLLELTIQIGQELGFI